MNDYIPYAHNLGRSMLKSPEIKDNLFLKVSKPFQFLPPHTGEKYFLMTTKLLTLRNNLWQIFFLLFMANLNFFPFTL